MVRGSVFVSVVEGAPETPGDRFFVLPLRFADILTGGLRIKRLPEDKIEELFVPPEGEEPDFFRRALRPFPALFFLLCGCTRDSSVGTESCVKVPSVFFLLGFLGTLIHAASSGGAGFLCIVMTSEWSLEGGGPVLLGSGWVVTLLFFFLFLVVDFLSWDAPLSPLRRF